MELNIYARKMESKRFRYSENDMHEALLAVENGMSIYSAAKAFKVPRMTLSDKLRGKTPIIRKMGPPSILSSEEEMLLEKWILHLASQIILEALEGETAGIKVNGVLINNIRYADDTVIIADCLKDLERVMDKILRCSGKYGLSLNVKKTKFMKISKNNDTNEILLVGGQQVERVKRYTYLGTLITENNDYTAEIKTRIEKARSNFIRMKKVLCSKDLTLHLKLRLAKCYVHSVLYYGVEAWTLNADAMRRLNSFEMWTYRRILRVSWKDRITNIEVLRRIGREKEVERTIKERKLQYLGHIMRGEKYNILRLIMQGKIEAPSRRERKRKAEAGGEEAGPPKRARLEEEIEEACPQKRARMEEAGPSQRPAAAFVQPPSKRKAETRIEQAGPSKRARLEEAGPSTEPARAFQNETNETWAEAEDPASRTT
ncbi:uncharacterized protein LOC123685370 [Harmonia axyridis]|uniref:uncharacterized protein LOC123685370 n=1 Tax=Harmonia axyridis TaxID=115357 RepID=UPI001E279A89|nr:uncharacterized protein LOC123685370 [Harmonia axyridis]